MADPTGKLDRWLQAWGAIGELCAARKREWRADQRRACNGGVNVDREVPVDPIYPRGDLASMLAELASLRAVVDDRLVELGADDLTLDDLVRAYLETPAGAAIVVEASRRLTWSVRTPAEVIHDMNDHVRGLIGGHDDVVDAQRNIRIYQSVDEVNADFPVDGSPDVPSATTLAQEIAGRMFGNRGAGDGGAMVALNHGAEQLETYRQYTRTGIARLVTGQETAGEVTMTRTDADALSEWVRDQQRRRDRNRRKQARKKARKKRR